MNSETRDAPHLSGRGLLAYIKSNGININDLKFGQVPQVLLKSHGEDTPVNVMVNLLLDDRNGEMARQFAQQCPAYEDNRGSENVGELQSLFETFIHTVLLGEKRETSKKRNEEDEGDEIMDTQTEELNQLHAQIDLWLDTWSEKYDELVGKTTEYICLLDDIYLDPKPESYKPKGIDTESSDEDEERRVHTESSPGYIEPYHVYVGVKSKGIKKQDRQATMKQKKASTISENHQRYDSCTCFFQGYFLGYFGALSRQEADPAACGRNPQHHQGDNRGL